MLHPYCCCISGFCWQCQPKVLAALRRCVKACECCCPCASANGLHCSCLLLPPNHRQPKFQLGTLNVVQVFMKLFLLLLFVLLQDTWRGQAAGGPVCEGINRGRTAAAVWTPIARWSESLHLQWVARRGYFRASGVHEQLHEEVPNMTAHCNRWPLHIARGA